MNYIYILVDCDGDSWNPVVRDIGHYSTEEAAVAAVPAFARKYETEPINPYTDSKRVKVRDFGYFAVVRVELLG